MEHAVTAMTHTLWIERWHPTTTNQLLRVHWGGRSTAKRRDADIVKVYSIRDNIPAATGKRRVQLTLVYPPGKRRVDVDASAKV